MTTLSTAIDQYLVIRRAKYAKGTTRGNHGKKRERDRAA